MYSLLTFFLFISTTFGQTPGTCDPAQSLGPANNGQCDPLMCPGCVTDASNPPECCPPNAIITTPAPSTAANTATTEAVTGGVVTTNGGSVVTSIGGVVVGSNSTCRDLLNPQTGVSDCPARASLCNDTTYYNVMTVQCPLTCNRCSNATTSTNRTCADLLNPQTGVSDCPARASLCNDTTYYNVMTVQCPRTCGRCNGTSSSTTSSASSTVSSNGTCVDLVNQSTGISDCPARSSLCTNAVYLPLMRVQCPLTCGFCSG